MKPISLLLLAACVTSCRDARQNEEDVMEGPSVETSDFWSAFELHSDELAGAEDADTPVYDLLLGELQKMHPELFFEFATDTDGSEVVITADGNRSLFTLVESVVAAAPDLSGWSVHGLKPKLGFPEVTRWEGLTISISDVAFEPMEKPEHPDLGLMIFVRDLASDDVGDAHNALLRALDHGLGERALAENIAHTEVHPLPQGASLDDLIPLAELEQYVAWRARRLSEKAAQQADATDGASRRR